MADNTKKAYMVSYPGFEFPMEFQITFAETRNKAKYAVMGSDGAEDVPWTDLRAVRVKSLDGHEEDYFNNPRFRGLWDINNDSYIDSWQLPDGTEVNLWDGYYEGYINGDDVRERLNIGYDYETLLTYDDIDHYANRVLKEKAKNDTVKS